jgi:acyl-coenzyme A thioesterase PaaI-like protein
MAGPGAKHARMQEQTSPFDPAAHGWEPYTDEGFIGLVGPFWTRTDGGTHRFAFMAQPKHHNRRGVLQGGMMMTFADRSLGMTAWYANGQKPQATVHLDVHFVDAVQIGEFVEAKCRVVRRTRSLIFMSGEFMVGERTVATANGVWKALGKVATPP